MEVRLWARAHGYDVGDQGRIAANIVDAFLHAHLS
ncbi:Lsr2 family DNA-binding protein [Frankia tisae]